MSRYPPELEGRGCFDSKCDNGLCRCAVLDWWREYRSRRSVFESWHRAPVGNTSINIVHQILASHASPSVTDPIAFKEWLLNFPASVAIATHPALATGGALEPVHTAGGAIVQLPLDMHQDDQEQSRGWTESFEGWHESLVLTNPKDGSASPPQCKGALPALSSNLNNIGLPTPLHTDSQADASAIALLAADLELKGGGSHSGSVRCVDRAERQPLVGKIRC